MWKPRINLIHSDSKQFWQKKKQQNKKTVVMGIAKTQKFVNHGCEIMLASLCDAYMQCWKYLGYALNEKQTDYIIISIIKCTLTLFITSKWLHLKT